ncbi:MAG: DUF1624 domain-containing protein [bacterium]|nr:DUF1624 domain-containing protein [bacterium]
METKIKRLGFIDAARALAIILMLQGHFISLTYKDYTAMAHGAIYGTSGNFFFDVWFLLRGFTAPLFFSITGLVFTFLLLRERDKPFWSQVRVRKGIKRGFEVMLWGYILCLNYKNWHLYAAGKIPDRTWSFHVLQSIGFSLFALIFLYALALLIKKVRVSALFLIVGTIIIAVTPFFKAMGDNYFPSWAPQIIQNMFNGPNSFFPIFPWLGYVLLGGFVGAILQEKKSILTEKWTPLKYAGIGAAVCLFIVGLVHVIDWIFAPSMDFTTIGIRFGNFAMVLGVLVGLLYLERSEKLRIPFLVEMGKNTLDIYIVHTIVLYGSVFGIGIRTYIEKDISFPMAILGAIAFILFFGLMTYFQNMFKRWWRARKTKAKTTEG